jgi:hypothetical protein
MKRATSLFGAGLLAAVTFALPALAQQAAPAGHAPSRAQAEVAAEMNATGSPYVAPAPPSRATPTDPSQTFGNGPTPSFRVLNTPVGVDAGVEQPYSNSWADTFAGQPGSSNHGEELARATGFGGPGTLP